jgi:hypothetical protein
MTPHAKIYMKHFDFVTQSEVMCEACDRPAVDIHHIEGRLGDKNDIKNLIALCRKCHERAHGGMNYVPKEQFQYIHNFFLTGKSNKHFLS